MKKECCPICKHKLKPSIYEYDCKWCGCRVDMHGNVIRREYKTEGSTPIDHVPNPTYKIPTPPPFGSSIARIAPPHNYSIQTPQSPIKVIRCYQYEYYTRLDGKLPTCKRGIICVPKQGDFCSYAERKVKTNV